MTIEIRVYTTASGQKPYLTWENSLNREGRAIVTTRLNRLRIDNFGDCKPVKGSRGVYELRIHFGPGYRIYFGKAGKTIVLLLCGGDKSTQRKDMKKAQEFWEDYRHND